MTSVVDRLKNEGTSVETFCQGLPSVAAASPQNNPRRRCDHSGYCEVRCTLLAFDTLGRAGHRGSFIHSWVPSLIHLTWARYTLGPKTQWQIRKFHFGSFLEFSLLQER